MKIKLTFIALLLAGTIGCNDPKVANENNLERGLNHYYEAKRNCWLWTKAGGEPPAANGTGSMVQLLVGDNLLKPKQGQGSGGSAPVYELTDKGLGTKTKFINVYGDDMDGYLCSGKLVVDRIVNFTQPSENNGTRITEVTFTTKIDDVPAWAKDPQFTTANPTFEPTIAAAGQKLEKKLLLTNKGWRVEGDM